MENGSHRRKILATGAVVGGLVLLALGLRLLGIRLGLPFVHHWDEVWIAQGASSMLRHHDDVPTSYQYGAPLMRLTVLGYKVLALVSHRALSPNDEVLLRWVARVVSALISSSGVIGMYLAGRYATGDKAFVEGRSTRAQGLAAAFLYATASELVIHGRYGVTDATLAAMAAWALGLSALYVARGRLYQGVLALLAAGIGFAFKIPGLPIALIPFLALALRPPAKGPRAVYRLLLVGAVPIVGLCFLALNPHVIDQWQHALRDITARIAQTKNGGFPAFLLRKPGLPHLASALWALCTVMWSRNLVVGLVIAAVALFGLFVGCSERRLTVWIGVVYAAAAALEMALPNRTFLVRNYLIVTPVLALGFGLGFSALWARLAARLERPPVVAALMLAPLVAFGGLRTWQAVENQRKSVDPRMRAMDFIERARGGRNVTVAFTPSVVGSDAIGARRGSRRDLLRPGVTILPREVRTAKEAAASDADYVVTASYRVREKYYPYVPQWFFQSVPGYKVLDRVEPNPYEHNFNVTTTWDGRVAVVVLGKR